jgi:flagellar basal-body rod protein FlgB
MSISNIPLFSMLRTRMQWHQERQRLLAENVANADTPRFQPRDLTPPRFDQNDPAGANVTLTRTSAAHLAGVAGTSRFQLQRNGGFEARPSGNAVSLEDQKIKVADNQMEFQAVTSLYTRGLALIRTAIGRSNG